LEVVMGGETEVGGIFADPWRGLRWWDYRAEVLRLSAYRPDRAASAARRGVLSELGEALGALDDRRVAKKGAEVFVDLRGELGDVLWYAALESEGDGVGLWTADPVRPVYEMTLTDRVDHVAHAIGVAMGDVLGGLPLAMIATSMCRAAGFSAQEVAWFNLEKLRARREAGTLHDREARGAGGGV
jgi:NTP pyrophosphatase (non-canonical NTP hydrolase)